MRIIIVAYRGTALLYRCLASLREHPYSLGHSDVVIVDNASKDGTADVVRDSFPQFELIELGENVGFARANNVVLQRTLASWSLLLNPDTEVTPGALDEMVAFMEKHPDAGVGGCRLVRPDGTFDHAAKRSFPTVRNAIAYFARQRSQSGYEAPHLAEHGVGEIDAVNGAFMLVRRTALQQVGPLDGGYWMYGEDLDWCFRFKERGWRVLYNGEVTIVHVKGGSAGARRSWKTNREFHRAMGRFYRKHYGGRTVLLDTVVYVGIGAKLITSATLNAIARVWVRGSRLTRAGLL